MRCQTKEDRPGQRIMPRSPAPKGHNMSAQRPSKLGTPATASTTRVLCHAWLVCITPGRGCAALGEGWQNQRKALEGRNKWRARQTPIRKPGQSPTRTETEQRRDRPSIAPPSRRETAAPARGDCCALSGLLGMFLSATQGGVTARKTRGHLPWADMLRPLRGKETRGNVSG